MFGTIVLYLLIFLFLRKGTRSTHENLGASSTHGATPLMLVYPLIYVVCTSPLAIGRIAALAGGKPSLAYFCVAGSMIACNGWLDVVLYASTRSEIVFGEDPTTDRVGLETFAFLGKGHTMGTITTVQAGAHQRSSSKLARGDSAENLYGLNQIGVKGEVTVVSETLPQDRDRRRINKVEHNTRDSWDGRSSKSASSQIWLINTA